MRNHTAAIIYLLSTAQACSGELGQAEPGSAEERRTAAGPGASLADNDRPLGDSTEGTLDSTEEGAAGVTPKGGLSPTGQGTANQTTSAGPEGQAGNNTAEQELVEADRLIEQELEAVDAESIAEDPQLFAAAELYFPTGGAQASPQRLYRLTRAQLDSTTEALLPELYAESVQESMPRDPLLTNYEYSDNLTFNAANFTPYAAWVTQIADRARAAPRSVIDCQQEDTACLKQAGLRFVSRGFREVPKAALLMPFVDLLLQSVESVGFADAVADLVDVTLMSPHYVFRDEVSTDSSGTLLDAQRLQQLSYTLADAPPEALGLSSENAADYFSSAENIERTLEDLLSTRQAKAKLLNFFLAWLEIDEADEFDISSDLFPEFTSEVAQAVVAETRGFLEQQLGGADPSLKAVTQSPRVFTSDALQELYASAITGSAEDAVGIFTQPAFIASHSGPETTRLIKRGVFFTRKAMCLPLGMPPEGTDTSLPVRSDATERERVASVTTPAECQGCHRLINPFGFMLESYDAIGRFREQDAAGLDIDPAIVVDFLDEGQFSEGTLEAGTTKDALLGFTSSWRFQQCFARQLFRFYMGRRETASDDPVLRQMFFRFANNDTQDIAEILASLVGSTNFSRRKEITR